MKFNDALFMIATVDTMKIAIPCSSIREILRMPQNVAMPHRPPYARGAANLRGSMVKVLDLRTLWNLTSHQDEINNFTAMLTAREEDHKKWLCELEASLKEKREFKLARDPRKCAFGKWFYSFQTDDHNLRMLLNKFEQPHQFIHSIADQAFQQSDRGNFVAAMNIIQNTRDNELHTMLTLFELARQVIQTSSRELLLVLTKGTQTLGIAIDAVQCVETISGSTVEPIETMLINTNDSGYISFTAKRTKTQEIVLLLDSDLLLEEFSI